MGFKDKIINKQAEKMMEKTGVNLGRVLESIHGHLEAQFKVQVEILNELRQMNKKPKVSIDDYYGK